MRPILLSALLMVQVIVPRAARAGDAWHVEFAEAQSVAKAQDKDLLIDFGGSDWCVGCMRLKDRILSKSEFIERAGRDFVLVDIDLPYRSPIPADRKKRYEELQVRYGVNAVPTVVLAMPDGRPYARTTYRESLQTPGAFWKHLQPLHERGQRLRAALSARGPLEGRARAEALAEGLSQINPRFIPLFYADRVAELRRLDPSDATGYLAFLDGRRALDEFQAGWDVHKAPIDIAAVDALIARAKLRGESLQEALVLRAAGEILAGRDRRALHTLAAAVDAQATRTRFDLGDFILLDDRSIATVRHRIAEGEADKGDGVALYYALHRILEFDLPNPYDWSCGEAFRPNIRVREVIGDRYGRALVCSTAHLKGEALARALAKGLDGTFFAARGSIREIVLVRLPGLVGKDEAKKLLPGEFYPRWIN